MNSTSCKYIHRELDSTEDSHYRPLRRKRPVRNIARRILTMRKRDPDPINSSSETCSFFFGQKVGPVVHVYLHWRVIIHYFRLVQSFVLFEQRRVWCGRWKLYTFVLKIFPNGLFNFVSQWLANAAIGKLNTRAHSIEGLIMQLFMHVYVLFNAGTWRI